jgi:hypothetical protein
MTTEGLKSKSHTLEVEFIFLDVRKRKFVNDTRFIFIHILLKK